MSAGLIFASALAALVFTTCILGIVWLMNKLTDQHIDGQDAGTERPRQFRPDYGIEHARNPICGLTPTGWCLLTFIVAMLAIAYFTR